MLLEIARFVFLALTDLAMLPALNVMKKNRRHFELFVGILHLIVAFTFNAAEAFDTELFLKEDDWHFISDVLTVSYFLLLCVHLMGYKDENHNIVLRYVAFACAWIFKTKDSWNDMLYQALLVICYIIGVFYRRIFTPATGISPLNKQNLFSSFKWLAAAFIALIIVLVFEVDENHNALGFAMGLLHIFGGASFYYAWLSVPCMDSKKDDAIPMHSVFV
ncbi:Protein of unknown function DUF3522 [Plasmopara halstedii]|uniref:Uncharacterized protein n=1 Tax=Plasmopara halstedii TaxID=4781 RepID=A0A0P1ANW0_PLAHL|nr:Protein of unknown function DUF3522 [Plasmopara halstedii]CEG43133.1 Protein of unknown function DUF3522 [Plasmopara halstedii]|eukprot:XP_024579502.1 Protein of unknown function DUF3522 [Plasmopara halstedii]